MVEQLIKDYAHFHDAIILNFEHKTDIEADNVYESRIQQVILELSCYRSFANFEKDTIRIRFIDVEDFRYIKRDDMVTSLFIGKENEFYVIDFDPILTTDKSGDWVRKKNPDSVLQVKFKELFYEVIK
ncbi:hypothetical protein [Flavobacterium sp. N1994]|uniref:hypothetical protein n=1 Tax=Flavobacterium sp. N1994 TaxID=2986827 RepID=UPI002222311A|nr:hypothetical protein [Flavobacterium sp. N1994]